MTAEIEGAAEFRRAADAAIQATALIQIAGPRMVQKAIQAFTEATVAYVGRLEAENAALRARLSGEAADHGVPPV